MYGNPELSKREEVWNKLRSLKLLAHPNWPCIGDFNQILNQNDKFSFHQGTIPGADSFHKMLSNLALCELAYSGQKFTWMNRREEEDFVMEKLDRPFASIEWVNTYPRYALRNLPIIHSDHGPILIDFEFTQAFRRRPFRFERMWLLHPTCKSVVQKAWHCYPTRSRALQLRNKLSNVRKEFTVWNKEVFAD